MKVLIVGNGGRESTIAWKLKESNKVDEIFIAPGNAGTEDFGENIQIKADNIDGLLNFAKKEGIDLTIVGPEVPLILGIVDDFEKEGLKIVGPSKKAAQLEGSKQFSKDLMKKYNIPTAKYETFKNYENAKEYLEKVGAPIVIKADGLAAGKGVIVAQTLEEAREGLKVIMEDEKFGKAGTKVVIEEFMEGQEASILAFTDGKTIKPMVSSQDHKRIYDGDKGPNTGGMGTYSPAPVITEELNKKIYDKILMPTLEALKKEGIKYKGILYAGLMITKEGPKVVEFNARFGDPETQVILPRLKSDLFDIFMAISEENLDSISIKWDNKATACVVMASEGYPISYEKGYEIRGIKEAFNKGLLVFQAGTKTEEGKILTNGGRVLGVIGKGDTIRSAVKKVYKNIDTISFKGNYYRKDIAHNALKNQ
ncbi:MAG: phosphoribosylamine--glycine ligase [Fusobacteriota bacterium]